MATPNLLAITTVTPGLLVDAQVASNAETILYTVPANSATKLAQGSITNTSGVAVTCGMSIVPASGASDGTHKILPDGLSIAANDSYPLADFIKGHMLGEGDKIAVHAGTSGVLDVVISGVVMS